MEADWIKQFYTQNVNMNFSAKLADIFYIYS